MDKEIMAKVDEFVKGYGRRELNNDELDHLYNYLCQKFIDGQGVY